MPMILTNNLFYDSRCHAVFERFKDGNARQCHNAVIMPIDRFKEALFKEAANAMDKMGVLVRNKALGKIKLCGLFPQLFVRFVAYLKMYHLVKQWQYF